MHCSLLSIISNDAALKSCDISSDSESCFPRPNTFKEALFIENHDDVTHQPSHTVAAPETNPFFINAVPQQNARLPAFVALSALESLDPHHECALASSSSYTFDNCGLGDDTKRT